MNHPRRGVALVINNIEFTDREKLKTREGAEFDSESLKRVLRKLHFEVRLYQDKTQCEMRELLEQLAREDHSDADCFICVMMSHGTKLTDGGLGVFGVDGEIVYIEAEAMTLFSNLKCPTLVKKPKLFLVDACWGGNTLNSTSILSNSTELSRTNGSSYTAEEFSINPNISDFLFSFSTLPNHVSLRDRLKGNWFIQEFATALDKFGKTRTLSDIMHKVRDKLMRKTTIFHAQMSVDHWMLSRLLIFIPKQKKILCSSKSNTYLLHFERDIESIEKVGYYIPSIGTKVLNTFEYLSLLTRIGESGKFASLSRDPKRIHIWVLLGERIETLFVLIGHLHNVTVIHSLETFNNKEMSVLASGSEDGSIRIWNVKNGECLQFILGHDAKVLRLEAVGMRKLASSFSDNSIRVWDVSFHSVLHGSFIFSDLLVHSLQIPQTNKPAMFVFASDKSIQVYNSTTWGFIQEIETSHCIEALEYFGGQRIVCGIRGGSIQTWNAVNKDNKCDNITLRLTNDALIKSLHSFCNNTVLAAVSFRNDYEARERYCWIDIWHIGQSVSHKQTIPIHDQNDLVSSLSLGTNELVVGFRNGTIQIRNVETYECKYLAREEKVMQEIVSGLYRLQSVGNGKVIAFYVEILGLIASQINVEAGVWNVETLTYKSINRHLNINRPLEWLGEERYGYFSGNIIQLLDSNGMTLKLTEHPNEISVLKWLGNDTMASGSKDGTIKLWHLDTGECLETFSGHLNEIVALELINENCLASFASNDMVRIWNIDFQQRKSTIMRNQGANNTSRENSVFKSVGTKNLAIVYPGKISVWDVVNDKSLPDLDYSSEELAISDNRDEISLLQSHGESTLISAIGSTIIVWNVETGERLHALYHLERTHSEKVFERITTMVVSRDTLISGSHSKTIIWDLATCTCLTTVNEFNVKSIHSIHKSLMIVLTNSSFFVFDIKTKHILIRAFYSINVGEGLDSLDYFFE